MKKANKILMKAIAILLCLILITASVVSSTLARFTFQKDATTTVKFEDFGVKMQIKNAGTVVSTLDSNSVTVTYDIVEIYPGYRNDKLVLFAFDDGLLTVPATLKVDFEIELDDVFYISSDDFTSLTTDYPAGQAYMPVGIRSAPVDSLNSESLNSPTSTGLRYTSTVDSLETTVESQFYNILNLKTGIVKGSGKDYANKNFAKNSAITFNSGAVGFGFGLQWSLGEASSVTNKKYKSLNMIETWIAEEIVANRTADPTYVPIRITITVSLEQTGT